MAGEIIYGVKDMGIHVLSGGAFGTKIDAPGVASFSVALSADSEEHFADDTILATTVTRVNANGSFDLGVIDRVSWAALTGGKTTTAGVAPNIVNYFIASSGTNRPLCQLAAISNGVGANGGVTVARVYQARINSGGGVQLGQNYGMTTFDYTAISMDGSYYQIEQHDNASYALPSAAVTAVPA